jgi:hypothetical protein
MSKYHQWDFPESDETSTRDRRPRLIDDFDDFVDDDELDDDEYDEETDDFDDSDDDLQ